MRHRNILNVATKRPPVVEMDSVAHAAYVRFSHRPVRQTKVITEDDCIVTVDLDAEGEVIGIEFIGVKEFSVRPLLKLAGVKVSDLLMSRARYVPAKLVDL